MDEHNPLYEISALSVKGRREKNEDAVLAVSVGDDMLLAVADGIGGQPAGEVASATAIAVLKSAIRSGIRQGMSGADYQRILSEAVFAAHNTVLLAAEGERRGMGTTLVAALVHDTTAVVVSCGDSRAYLIGEEVRQITTDHSLVAGLLEKGLITAGEARVHPMRHIITHSIGGDFLAGSWQVILGPGDVLLLCSDGLYEGVSEEALAKIRNSPSLSEAGEMLISRALQGAGDNISLILLREKGWKKE